ncbi:MAG: T9SS type A sorting domain-containing protein [Chitinivibrionales bacterium]|nr:T9SS type A sorting domain-containing protein [Chitinivibrionales bacterium]
MVMAEAGGKPLWSTDIPSFKVNGTVLTVNNPLKREMKVIINDARGKIVQSIRLSNNASIDLSARGLSAGVYYCSVAGRDIRKFSIIR